MVQAWMQQYGDVNEIKTVDVKLRLRKSDEVDLNFKLNFIVLFASIMGKVHITGACDLTILDYITPTTNLSNINWCEYIWSCLKTCKKGWKMGKKDSFFRGPLTLLTMIYVDAIKSPSKIVSRRRPPTKVWTFELLSERESDELNNGGFVLGELEEEFVDDEEEAIPHTIEGCTWLLNRCVSNISYERKVFDKVLEASKNMFPDNLDLFGIEDKYVTCLNHPDIGATKQPTPEKEPETTTNNVASGDVVGTSTVGKQDLKADASGSEMQSGCLGNNFRETTPLIGFDSPDNLCGDLTQKAFIRVAENVEKSIERSNLRVQDDIPSFSLNITQDFGVTPVINNKDKILTPMPISACKPEGEPVEVFLFHGRRVTSKSNMVRSPYHDRVVDVDTSLNSDESKVAKFLFQTVHDSDAEVLYLGMNGHQSTRVQMESLGSETVDNNILDTWVDVKNYMEKYKSNDSPLRLFLPVFVVVKETFSELRHKDDRYKLFVHHIESVTRNDNEMKTLKKIDLVFLPVDNEGHRFLLAFDIKYGAVTVFDQTKKDISVKKKVKKGVRIGSYIVAENLHADFERYLYSLGHSRASPMITAQLVYGEFDWQMAIIRPYAGFLIMRIMETYMGKGMPNWDLRLVTSRGKIQRQLTMLCKKYDAGILMSDCNTLNGVVRGKIEKGTGELEGVPLIKGVLKIKG